MQNNTKKLEEELSSLEIQWRAEEWQSAMIWLDNLDVPREMGSNTYSIVGRIARLVEMSQKDQR